MRTLKIVLQYDGTEYVGWQRQANGPSIQALLEDALEPIEGSRVVVHGAGRTDAGVHALGQVATVTLAVAMEPPALARALNAVLPPDVRVLTVEDAAPGFHARFSATGKVYEYRIVNAPIVSPFLQKYVWHVGQPIDLQMMREASALLVGTHDFAAFQGARAKVTSTTRTVRGDRMGGRRRLRSAARHADRGGRVPAPHGPEHRRDARRRRPRPLAALARRRDSGVARPDAGGPDRPGAGTVPRQGALLITIPDHQSLNP